MKLARRNIKNSAAAAATLLVALILQLLFWFKAAWPAGGQDSWNHYLFARFAPKHPELYLDQCFPRYKLNFFIEQMVILIGSSLLN